MTQSFDDFEVIVVDDGSTDGSAEIARDFAKEDSRVKVYSKANEGCIPTRIYGLRRAKGEYILQCDADDYYIDNAFMTLRETAVETGCELIQFEYYKRYNHLRLRKRLNISATETVDRETFSAREYPLLLCSFYDAAHLNINIWTKLYHRRLLANLEDLKPKEKIFMGDDLIVNLHLLKDCRSAAFLNKPLYVYRALVGMTGILRIDGSIRDLNAIKQYQLQFLETWNGKDKDKVEATLFSETAGWFFCIVQSALSRLDEPELSSVIDKALKLPSFVKAREYYRGKGDQNTVSKRLMADGDARRYIECAGQAAQSSALSDRVKKIARQIAYRI